MPTIFDPDSAGATALRSTIASTLASRLEPLAFDADVLPQYAVVLLATGTSQDDVASAVGEFLEPAVARDFAAWLFDHVKTRANDYGFFVDENAAEKGGMRGGSEAEDATGDAAENVEDETSNLDAERARSDAAAGGRGGAGRGGASSSFSREGRGGVRGRGGRGGGGFDLGVSKGGRGGRGSSSVSKAGAASSSSSSSSRSVFDRLGTAAKTAAVRVAAVDAATEAAEGTGAEKKPSIGDPARLGALREQLVRLRDAAASASEGGADAPPPPSSGPAAATAAGRTVLVKNVHFDADDAALFDHFASAGLRVERATVARSGAGRGASKGYGVVALASVEAAKRALALSGSTLEGREIDVVPALPTGIALGEKLAAPSSSSSSFGNAAFRGRGAGRFARGRRGRGGRGGGFSSSHRHHHHHHHHGPPRSMSYVSPELVAQRAAEAAAAKRAALDAELDAMSSGRGQ